MTFITIARFPVASYAAVLGLKIAGLRALDAHFHPYLLEVVDQLSQRPALCEEVLTFQPCPELQERGGDELVDVDHNSHSHDREGQARKWQDEGLTAVSVAVNVSAVQFRREGFSELIRQVLFETGLAPQYLELEVTESLLLSSADVTLSVLQELKAMGLTLAIDDFGTGYSNFGCLKQFRVSKLKIDRVFVRDVALNPDDAAITTAIISMAKSLNLKVIAEGVEDEAQMSFLRAHHCDEIQGYYFSKPLVADEVADKLRAEHSEARVKSQASGKQS